MTSLEIQEAKRLLTILHRCTTDLAGLINSRQNWIDTYGPNYVPKPGTMSLEDYRTTYKEVVDSYDVSIERYRAKRARLKKVLATKGHIPNKAERRKIRQDAAKNRERKE